MSLAAQIILGLALLPLALTLINLAFFRKAPPPRAWEDPVSVLIPARDEAANIEAAVRSVLAGADGPLEVVVLDDHSADDTAAIVRRLAAEDRRVRLEHAPPLPAGWAGKQHACKVLAERAAGEVLVFMDADVRLEPGGVGRMVRLLRRRRLALLSGFPRQITGSLGERLIVPQITMLLLGYLPMMVSRLFPRVPGFAAGCGQLMAVRREAYDAVGGHAAVRRSFHDGMTLPRVLRRGGHATDLFDASDLARCRMYAGFAATWAGFSKNATEGMATPVGLPVWTVLLLGGHLGPWLLLAAGETAAGLLGIAATLGQRLLLAVLLRQSLRAVPWHPVGVVALLALQWGALIGALRGRRPSWRGRSVTE